MMDCKQALADAGGDIEAAIDTLRKRGITKAAKKVGRQTSEGRVDTYVHPGWRVGVMVEINCETDFVAKTNEFGDFVKNICMQIAAANPEVVRREDLPEERVRHEREIFTHQARESGKPENVIGKIVDGMMNKFYAEACLLEQPYVRDPKQTVADYVNGAIAKIGENIQVRRFARFELGK
jgi:elongation factor Ts